MCIKKYICSPLSTGVEIFHNIHYRSEAKIKIYNMGSREASLRLYRAMMREASRLPDFNFRSYFQRRIRDGFRSAQQLENTAEIEARLARAQIDLAMLQRQATLGQLFNPHIRLPIEK